MRRKSRISGFATLFIMFLAVIIGGCPEVSVERIDSFINTVVVEKIEPTQVANYRMLKIVNLDEEKVFVFRLDENPSRPLQYIWDNIEIGTNLSFQYLESTGKPKYLPDGIFALTTADIVILDEPENLKQMLILAKEKKKELMLKEEERQKALQEFWEQIQKPKD